MQRSTLPGDPGDYDLRAAGFQCRSSGIAGAGS